MKKIFLIFLGCFVGCGATFYGISFNSITRVESVNTVTDAPVIYFSDLTSGPNSGGENNKGVYVTVWGKNFGNSQETSTITVGGGAVDNYPVWGSGNGINSALDMVCFQLGSNAATGNIVMTTSVGTSNGVSFTVRSGNVYFIDDDAGAAGDGSFGDEWDSPQDCYDNGVAGDTFIFRASEWVDTHYGRAGVQLGSILNMTNMASGTSGNEIAWVAYPGETVLWKATYGEGFHTILFDVQDYMVWSKMHIWASVTNNGFGDYVRYIGNDMEGTPGGGSIGFGGEGDFLRFLGNWVHGSTYWATLYHPLYLGNIGVHLEDFEIGWCKITDNDNGAYSIKLTHDPPGGVYTGSIHDCFMKAAYNKQRGVIFGPGDFEKLVLDTPPGGAGWPYLYTITGQTSGETAKISKVNSSTSYVIESRSGAFTDGEVLIANGETADQGAGYPLVTTYYDGVASSLDFYNNIMVGYGMAGGWSSFRIANDVINTATLNMYNNVFFDFSAYAIWLFEVGTASNWNLDVQNNIFFSEDADANYITAARQYIDNLSDNAYYGQGNGPVEDSDPINADPQFTDAANDDFTLQVGSPAIDAGFDTSGTVARDYNGITRPQNSVVDIGAHEQ